MPLTEAPPPNARIVLRKDGRVWVEIISPIRLGEPILIDYDPYYWIYFWHRLSLTAQVQLQQTWRHIPFPPSGRAQPSPPLPTASERLSATT
jgi:hypothetical protein